MHLGSRAERASDLAFVQQLDRACSPLAGLVPDAVFEQQIALRVTGLTRDYPKAMRRIILLDGDCVGRIMVDWLKSESWCVDIAILPGVANCGIGSAVLRRWIGAAEALGMTPALVVARTNRAASLYHRLGFRERPEEDPDPVNATLLRSADAI